MSRRSKNEAGADLYYEIKELMSQLCQSHGTTRVTQRRETGKRVLEILSKERNRIRLLEAMEDLAKEKGYSRAGARKKAHELLWGPIIKNAFQSARNLVSGKTKKSKLEADDIKLPLKILHYSDSSSSEGNQVRIESTGKSNSSEIHNILNFCFDMLEDDEVRNIAELELMNTMVYLCERVDYVAYLKPEDEVLRIITTVENALFSEDGDTQLAAARIFGAILESCVELGMGLFVLVNRSLKLVARWCKDQLEDATKNPRELNYLFRGVTAVLHFHPEQSIKPLSRFGRHLLKFAKRSYLTATTQNKHAIHGYLIAHIIVNQKAGELRGLLPGELGDLGRATLNSEQLLEHILPMVLSSLDRVELTLTVKKRVRWKTLDATIRRHLECCARLLACAQRQFLVDEEWKLLDDPSDFFARMAVEFSKDKEDVVRNPSNSKYPCCPASKLAGSPWAQHILKPLLQMLPELKAVAHLGTGPTVDSFSQNSTQDTCLDRSINPSLRHPLLDCIHESKSIKAETDINKPSLLLLVISACAEAFPSGRCWASTSHKEWFTLRPDDEHSGDIVHVNGCSLDDLAFLVHVVANVLEACGGSTGDTEVQMLSLLCLIRLTEHHSVLVSLIGEDDMTDLAASWRQVWAILFRLDLRYSASTAHASEGSCGELVLILLAEIVQGWCTDPAMALSQSVSQKQSTFLYRKQFQIWALPAFGKGTALRTKQAFELAYSFLHRTCLSDEGRDNIQDEASLSIEGGSGRRHRLVCLCLHVLDSLKLGQNGAGPNERQMANVVTACLSALANGKISVLTRTFLDETQNMTWVRSSSIIDLKSKFCFTEMTGLAVSVLNSPFHDPRSSLFRTLWTSPILDPGASPLHQLRWEESKYSDCALAEKLKLCDRIRSREASSAHVDYVARAMSNSLHDTLQSHLQNILTRWTEIEGEDPEAQTDGNNAHQRSLEAALSVSCLWLKVSLGICVGVDEDKMSLFLEQWQDKILTTMTKIKSALPALCKNPNEFHAVFLDLLQIFRCLTELSSLSSIVSVAIPATLRGGISSFAAICDSLLLSFAGVEQGDQTLDDNVGDDLSTSSSESEDFQTKTNNIDLLDDSDDDEIVNRKKKPVAKKRKTQKSKKRKSRSKHREGSPKRKKKKQHPSPPNSSCACIVGSVLITLEPSVARCESVIDSLLKKGKRDSEVDLTEAYHCLGHLCDPSVIFHDNAASQMGESTSISPVDESFRQQSPISLICSILEKLRHSAPAASSLHMYGFQLYADCVRLGDSDLRGMKLTMDEARQIADSLLDFGESLQLRPYLRHDRLRAATKAYRLGDEIFRSAMEKYRGAVMKASFKDLCPHVRSYACCAAGVALVISPDKDTIARTMLNRLPPVVLPLPEDGNRKGKQKTYQDWYQNEDLRTGDLDAENQIWNDALMSMERTTITCRSVFAGVHADCSRDNVCDLIKIASTHSYHEATCFHACEKIALMLGFDNAEDYLDDMSEGLLLKWIERGETLGEIPLLLSSPSMIRLLLQTGRMPFLHVGPPKDSETDTEKTTFLNGTDLEDVATDAFVARHKAYVLPQILLRVCSLEQNDDMDSMTRIAGDKIFQEFCIILENTNDETAITTIFQSGLEDIEALCAPLAPMDHGDLANLRQDVMKLVDAILKKESEGEAQQKRGGKPHLTIRRILELSGKESREIYPVCIVQEAFSEAISGFVDKLKPTKNGDILSAAGTSLTECFLYARQWLESATLPTQKQLRWRTLALLFDLIFKQIGRKEFKQTQLLFGMDVLVDVLLNPKLACIHSKTMLVLNQVLGEVVASVAASDVLKQQFSLGSKRFVGSLMKIHEESQQELVRLCRQKAERKLQAFQRSVGLLGIHAGSSDPWGWDSNSFAVPRRSVSVEKALREFHSGEDKFLIEAITGTFDLLTSVFDNAKVLGLQQECFIGCMPPFSVSHADQEALGATNPRFCAQKVAQDFVVKMTQTDVLSQSIDSLLEELKNHSSWMNSLSRSSRTSKLSAREPYGGGSTLSMSQWMLRAALVQLERKLRDNRMSKEKGLREGDGLRLVQELSFVCGASCPQELRSAASRCLGELDPKLIIGEPAIPIEQEQDRIQQALEGDNLLRGIQAHAIEVLGEYLHSRHSRVAIAAVDTLIALLATSDGRECWDSLDEKAQERLLPVLSGKRKSLNLSKMSLSKLRVASIKSKAGIAANAMESSEWCWEKFLWQCPSDLEAWICDLVPALIVCCYHDATQSSSAFFCACQIMASIAPRFATAIFPAIVLDLLEKSASFGADSPQSVSSFKLVAQDTWICPSSTDINRRLSSSFAVLLGQSYETKSVQDTRAIALALDTLDLLRRATQSRFQKSGSHKRNSNAMPTSSRTGKKGNKSSRNSKSPKSANGSVVTEDGEAEHNLSLGEMVPWRGVPFGTVLKLNGELVVQACIRVQRYASALFYSALYFESCFAGSGAVMERLAKDFTRASTRAMRFSKADISGYFVDAKTYCEPSALRKRAVSSCKLLSECYMQLNEVDAFQAVERQSSDLRYGDCNSLAMDNGEDGRAMVPSLGELQRLDSISTTPRDLVSTSACLESLGLRGLLQSYIGSIEWSKVSSMTVKERRKLREKWFESRLYEMNWDNALLDAPGITTAGVGLTNLGASSKRVVLGESELSREEMGFHEAITSALSSFAHDDQQSCKGLLTIARASLLDPISSTAAVESFEQGAHMLQFLERLQFLNDIENLVHGPESIDNLLQRWGFSEKSDRVQAPTELVLTTSYASAGFSPHMREAVIRFLHFKSSQQSLKSEVFDPQQCLVEHLWSFGRWCRKMKFLPAAESSLQRLRAALRASSGAVGANSSSLELVLEQRLEEAQLRESKGDFATATRVAKQVIGLLIEEKKRGNDPGIDCILVDALVSCGGWLSKHKVEPARIILESYFSKSSQLAKALLRHNNTPENARRSLQAQVAVARLASSLYDSISARVKSPEWIKAGKSLAQREQELKDCVNMLRDVREKKTKEKNKNTISQLKSEEQELQNYGRQLKPEILLAKEERVKTEKALRDHLLLAVRSFLSALSLAGVGQEMDMSRYVFRMVFLWLSNCSEGEHAGVNTAVEEYLDRLPSFRFVALTSQLFAQIDKKNNSAFQATLHKLVFKMCSEHPYHCLVQLISVCNGREVGAGVSGRNADRFVENMSQDKVDAAAGIANDLKRKKPAFVGELLNNYVILMRAYIELANAPTLKYVANQTKRIPLNQASKNHSLDRCLSRRQNNFPAVLTSPPPVRSGCDYGDGREDPIGGERVKGFERTFSITDSGLHRPKIVMCEGSKGGRFRQLVKGEDEIRQDAVMEQVFTYVNDLMRRKDANSAGNDQSSTNDLHMVTYNIVPLSPASGVLEWVENSITFGDYILDTKGSKGYKLGSHSRYYPGEWGHGRCRAHLQGAPVEKKKETFDAVCRSFSPSFRFFFVERFGHDLKRWYHCQKKYTRSVAVSSIVGHILGIGDRHTNNILVSQITGEVVHIDFGIVFEQGKVLGVPELVPFRLTRNIIDGMGPAGTEGTFTRSAEATAVVLRENGNALLTILSAIASDPLYRWSVSPVEARRRQRLTDDDNQPAQKKGKIKDGRPSRTESKSERNEAAALVLTKIQEKLQGYEDGTAGEQQGIEGQVQLLINSARDSANLSFMFPGWASWV